MSPSFARPHKLLAFKFLAWPASSIWCKIISGFISDAGWWRRWMRVKFPRLAVILEYNMKVLFWWSYGIACGMWYDFDESFSWFHELLYSDFFILLCLEEWQCRKMIAQPISGFASKNIFCTTPTATYLNISKGLDLRRKKLQITSKFSDYFH